MSGGPPGGGMSGGGTVVMSGGGVSIGSGGRGTCGGEGCSCMPRSVQHPRLFLPLPQPEARKMTLHANVIG